MDWSFEGLCGLRLPWHGECSSREASTIGLLPACPPACCLSALFACPACLPAAPVPGSVCGSALGVQAWLGDCEAGEVSGLQPLQLPDSGGQAFEG